MKLVCRELARAFALMALIAGCGGGKTSGSSDDEGPSEDDVNDDQPDDVDDDVVTDDDGPGPAPVAAEPSFVGIHRLNNVEYDNTVKDLLGVDSSPASTFVGGEEALGFDNVASALGMTPAQFEQYFNAGEALAEKTFADARLRGRIMTCTPSGPNDRACFTTIIEAFGRRAYRRPLTTAEVDRLIKVASEAIAAGEDTTGAVRHIVATMLASPPFLYRLELDPMPGSGARRKLDGWELASRLSYFLWRTMPDESLFAAAADEKLVSIDGLRSHTRRLLGHERARGFVDGFAGQWLKFRKLESHQVETSVFKTWDEPLRASMLAEGRAFFQEYLEPQGRTMRDFFSAKLNFVDARLARHYGVSPPSGSGTSRLENAIAERIGFVGTGAFLTATSFSYRTSPTLRGVTVVRDLLCEELPDPPMGVPPLDETANDAAASQNVRERLAAHRTNEGCAACHSLFDPLGLGLENFDGVGLWRDKYQNGDVIDPTGELPDGTKFSGLKELAPILAKDERFAGCVAKKLFVYAHGRAINDADEPTLEALTKGFDSADLALRTLVEATVLSETFRSRRAEGAQ